MKRKNVFVGSFMIVAMFIATCGMSYAKTINVTSGDISGPGSLYQAVADASDGDVIVLDVNVWTDYGPRLIISIAKNVKIDGRGKIVYCKFVIASGATVTITDMLILGGYQRGCIDNYGKLTLNNISASLAASNACIYNDGAANIIINNSSIWGNGDPMEAYTVGILNSGNAVISDTTIGGYPDYFYTSNEGRGILNSGTMNLTDSTVSKNMGGIENTGTMKIVNSHITDNNLYPPSVGGYNARAGGVYNSGILEIL